MVSPVVLTGGTSFHFKNLLPWTSLFHKENIIAKSYGVSDVVAIISKNTESDMKKRYLWPFKVVERACALPRTQTRVRYVPDCT